MEAVESKVIVVVDTSPPELVADAAGADDLIVVVDYGAVSRGSQRVDVTRFQRGVVSRAGWNYEVHHSPTRSLMLADSGSYDHILAGGGRRGDLYLFCDDHQHPNIVRMYHAGMECATKPPVHPIRRFE